MKIMKKLFNLQLFASEENTNVTSDMEPGISIDFTTRISSNIKSLQTVLGVTDLIPMAAGTDIKVWKLTKVNTPEQVGEGETIPLTKFERKLVKTITLDLDKYRKNTTAELIQKVGRNMAINQTDEKLVSEVQKDTKATFYSVLKTGTGSATGTNLQTALANLWAKLQNYYEDMDVQPVYFINPGDIADYLGKAQITTQNAFGFTYIENFLGLGTAIVSPQVTEKEPVATAKENLRGAYVPMSGDVAQTFNLSADTTGLIGMTHSVKTDNATIETLVMSCVKFFPEYIDGVFKATITAE